MQWTMTVRGNEYNRESSIVCWVREWSMMSRHVLLGTGDKGCGELLCVRTLF